MSARRPFLLTTGRLRDQWHGMSRSGKVPQLWGHTPRAAVAIHPVDVVRRGLVAGGLVRVRGERGELVLPLETDEGVAPGQAWIPMHWGGATLAQAGVNVLTSPAVDPVSGQPALKQTAVGIEPARLDWQAAWAAVARDAAEAVAWMDAVRPHLAQFGYAALSLGGRERPVLALRVANGWAPPEALLAPLDRAFGCTAGEPLLRLSDPRRGVDKRARIENGRLTAVRLAGEVVAFDWIAEAMAAGADAGPLRPWLFAPVARPPQGLAGAGRTVCNCFGVSEAAIREAVAAGADLERLQADLRCGTSCGSCLPALRRLVGEAVPAQR